MNHLTQLSSVKEVIRVQLIIALFWDCIIFPKIGFVQEYRFRDQTSYRQVVGQTKM